MDFSSEYCKMCSEAQELQDYWREVKSIEKDGFKREIKCNKKSGDFFFLGNIGAYNELRHSRGMPDNLCLLGGKIYHLSCSLKQDDDIEFSIEGIGNLGRGGFWNKQKIIKDNSFFDISIWLPRIDQVLSLLKTDLVTLFNNASFEQYALREFMYNKYQKIWNGKKWINKD